MEDPNALSATLIVSNSSSECGRCHKGTLIAPTHHDRVVGYGVEPAAGCGARFTAITIGQLGRATRLVKLVELRPDLPLVVPTWMTIPDSADAAEAERILQAAFDEFRAAVARWKDARDNDEALHLIGEQRWEAAHTAAEEFDAVIARLRHETEG